jgi:2-keto-4-pentenoate hydratase/2-oxohepta-3-ene-1,7-dioic acid hydratase in catechol pathway
LTDAESEAVYEGQQLLPMADIRLLAPIAHPGKIVCVGLNYYDHCREQGVEPPTRPMLFAKFANAITDPGIPIVRPRTTEMLDLECELAVVIGWRASRVSVGRAMDHVFGFTILNDVTARDLQPGDIIGTGTPAGVGHYPDPPSYLAAGDVMGCQIAGIGVLENLIVDELPRADDHALAAGVAEQPTSAASTSDA